LRLTSQARNPKLPVNGASHTAFRLITLLFAMLLGLQCVWLLTAELSRSRIHRLPTDVPAAAAAGQSQPKARRAAALGIIRGDLWAEAGFTYADLLWGDGSAELSPELAQALSALDHAVETAPHQSGAWLLLAGLASRHASTGVDPVEALKMSYYTGPSEPDLMLPRLRIAARSPTFSDVVFRDFVNRDVRLLLAHQQNATLASVYSTASPAGKHFLELTVDHIDPAAAKTLVAVPD
jgi:hypothetical protein